MPGGFDVGQGERDGVGGERAGGDLGGQGGELGQDVGAVGRAADAVDAGVADLIAPLTGALSPAEQRRLAALLEKLVGG